MNRHLSQKFRFFTFVSIALLVYVHGYNLQNTYLAPFSTVDEPLTLTTFFEYWMANGILRFRIPLLFLISGYLYALYDHRSYWYQVKNRTKTLLIPYLLWSSLGLLLTFTLQLIPYTAKIVYETGIDQIGDNRPYLEIGWKGMFERLLFAPISYQLWFILALYFYNLIYPLIRWMIIKIPYIWLPLTFLLFFFIFELPVIGTRGLFFFSFGIWLQKKSIAIDKPPKWFNLGIFLILFVGISVIRTFMAFELEPNIWQTAFILIVVYQLNILIGITAMWFGADYIIHWFFQKQWFNEINGYSFFIFGFHVPLLPYFMKWALMTFSFIPYYRIILYLIIPILIILISVEVGKKIKKFMPRFYVLLTGGRGF